MAFFRQTFQVPKMEVLTYKLYGYGLYKGKRTPKIAENKVQNPSILEAHRFRSQITPGKLSRETNERKNTKPQMENVGSSGGIPPTTTGTPYQ